MDPAAIGTALIGLDAIRRREAFDSSTTSDVTGHKTRSSRSVVRVAIARSLRAAANAIDAHPLERAPGT